MAENLQQAFSSLEGANRKLEQDVEQKKRLLAERKELVDNLSHEMKTPLGVIRAYACLLYTSPAPRCWGLSSAPVRSSGKPS